jgi:hypothetical protein
MLKKEAAFDLFFVLCSVELIIQKWQDRKIKKKDKLSFQAPVTLFPARHQVHLFLGMYRNHLSLTQNSWSS